MSLGLGLNIRGLLSSNPDQGLFVFQYNIFYCKIHLLLCVFETTEIVGCTAEPSFLSETPYATKPLVQSF